MAGYEPARRQASQTEELAKSSLAVGISRTAISLFGRRLCCSRRLITTVTISTASAVGRSVTVRLVSSPIRKILAAKSRLCGREQFRLAALRQMALWRYTDFVLRRTAALKAVKPDFVAAPWTTGPGRWWHWTAPGR